MRITAFREFWYKVSISSQLSSSSCVLECPPAGAICSSTGVRLLISEATPTARKAVLRPSFTSTGSGRNTLSSRYSPLNP